MLVIKWKTIQYISADKIAIIVLFLFYVTMVTHNLYSFPQVIFVRPVSTVHWVVPMVPTVLQGPTYPPQAPRTRASASHVLRVVIVTATVTQRWMDHVTEVTIVRREWTFQIQQNTLVHWVSKDNQMMLKRSSQVNICENKPNMFIRYGLLT